MLDNSPPPAGHNQPPAFREGIVAQHSEKAARFLDAAGDWIEAGPITTDEQAAKLNDFIQGVKGVAKAVEADRKADKQPHDAAGRAVQAAYKPIIDRLEKAAARVAPMQTAWLKKLQTAQKAEAERKAQQAAEAEAEAQRKADQAATRNDISGEADAEAELKAAEKLRQEANRAAKAPAKVGSATGGARTASLRTSWTAEATNLRVGFMHYAEHPEIRATLERLATQEARSKGFDPNTQTIPGFKLIKKEVAV